MMRKALFGSVAILAAGALLAPSFAGEITVGQFYSQLAQSKHLSAADAVSAEAGLRHAGVELPKLALGQSLTEGDLAAISKALGIAVTTQQPSKTVNEAQVTTFLSGFRSQLAGSQVGSGSPFQAVVAGEPGNSGSSKGLKKGHHKSTSEPS